MTLNIRVPELTDLKPKITVLGVGGAGGNAVNNMIDANLEGVEFVVANTDAQALRASKADRRVQMGVTVTGGLGAGADPRLGARAGEDAVAEILDHIGDSNMVFVTAGMGGGTGTGAAPVLAAAAREQGILTVGVVTRPFTFEGVRRARVADAGIAELQAQVNTLIVIPNQNLFRVANEKTTIAEAFSKADDVLRQGVSGITDLMVKDGLVNLDFNDVRAVMSLPGKAMLGTGLGDGEERGRVAAERAILNPLLEDISVTGARAILVSVIGGSDMALMEVEEAVTRASEEIDPEANVIFGAAFDERLEGKVQVTIVATGLESEQSASGYGTNADASGHESAEPAQAAAAANSAHSQGALGVANSRHEAHHPSADEQMVAHPPFMQGRYPRRAAAEMEKAERPSVVLPRLPTPAIDWDVPASAASNASDKGHGGAVARDYQGTAASSAQVHSHNASAGVSQPPAASRMDAPAAQGQGRRPVSPPSAPAPAPAASNGHGGTAAHVAQSMNGAASLNEVLRVAREQESMQHQGESGVGTGMLVALRRVGNALRGHGMKAKLTVSGNDSAGGASGNAGYPNAAGANKAGYQNPAVSARVSNSDVDYDTPAFMRRGNS